MIAANGYARRMRVRIVMRFSCLWRYEGRRLSSARTPSILAAFDACVNAFHLTLLPLPLRLERTQCLFFTISLFPGSQKKSGARKFRRAKLWMLIYGARTSCIHD